MEQFGNKVTFNLEGVLKENIISSEYWKECQHLTNWTEVVDEIYNEVSHCEPWMGGNARGPSTAFCLLYKLFTMKISVDDIYGLLDHGDSPYIRAIGFLYLRYVGDPKTLWSWYERYVNDEEEIQPEDGGKTVTIGMFVRDLLLEQVCVRPLHLLFPITILVLKHKRRCVFSVTFYREAMQVGAPKCDTFPTLVTG
mmetsp:Transcript_7899/g.9160  ORF Transcript_7899/g.9160 Transcript_7899/m.9160 type:complete len:196 (-) Transcript_7899:1442-2029(-)